LYPKIPLKLQQACVLGAYSSDIIAYCLGRYAMKFILQHKKLARFIQWKSLIN
jgi:membrane protein DedA with SNARE-associated domain